MFLEALQAGQFNSAEDKAILGRIASAVLLRGSPDVLRLTRNNGSAAVYTRRVSPRKVCVKKSQANKRRAIARKELLVTCPDSTSAPAAAVDSSIGTGEPSRRTSTSASGAPSAEEQVGLLEVVGLSQRGFALIRRIFGGGRVGMASVNELRLARKRLAAMPANQIKVDSAGAHTASLSLAVQERVSALCQSGRFVERHVYDEHYRPMPKTALLTDADASDPGVLAGCPPPNMKDVHVTIGLDKGGCPSSVKIVVGIINQARPNNPNNTILAAVCPCDKDNYDDLDSMLKTLAPQVTALLAGGILVDGERRAVRLFLTGDYAALCTVLGHKGPSATMPCLMCLSTRSPSSEHSVLDAKYLTLQDITGSRTLRSSTQFASGARAGRSGGSNDGSSGGNDGCGGGGTPSNRQLAHLSVVLPPLLTVDPRQIVVIPLHLTLGVNGRFLVLATECVIKCKGSAAGLRFTHRLAALLRDEVGVTPVPYHGGGFIGRDCHRIGDKSDAICRLLLLELTEEYHTAYIRAWLLWNSVRKPLNRAGIATCEEVKQFRVDATALVTHLKRSFPWMNISPKLHLLLCHAADFMHRYGSIGMYGEQAIEAWHGRYGQSARKYSLGSELASAAAFMRAMALAREACELDLASYGSTRKPAALGARKSTKVGDKRLRQNREEVPVCAAKEEKARKDRKKWADDLHEAAADTISAHVRRGKRARRE